MDQKRLVSVLRNVEQFLSREIDAFVAFSAEHREMREGEMVDVSGEYLQHLARLRDEVQAAIADAEEGDA